MEATTMDDDVGSLCSGRSRVSEHLDRCKFLLQKIQEEIEAEEDIYSRVINANVQEERQEGIGGDRAQAHAVEARVESDNNGSGVSRTNSELDRILASFDWNLPILSREADQISVSSKVSSGSTRSRTSLRIQAKPSPPSPEIHGNSQEFSDTESYDGQHDDDPLHPPKKKKSKIRVPLIMQIKKITPGRFKTIANETQLPDYSPETEVAGDSEQDAEDLLERRQDVVTEEMITVAPPREPTRKSAEEQTLSRTLGVTSETETTQDETLPLQAGINLMRGLDTEESAELPPPHQFGGQPASSVLNKAPNSQTMNHGEDSVISENEETALRRLKEKSKAKKLLLAKLKHRFLMKQAGGTSMALGEIFEKLADNLSNQDEGDDAQMPVALISSRRNEASTIKKSQLEGNDTDTNRVVSLLDQSNSNGMYLPRPEQTLLDNVCEKHQKGGTTMPGGKIANESGETALEQNETLISAKIASMKSIFSLWNQHLYRHTSDDKSSHERQESEIPAVSDDDLGNGIESLHHEVIASQSEGEKKNKDERSDDANEEMRKAVETENKGEKEVENDGETFSAWNNARRSRTTAMASSNQETFETAEGYQTRKSEPMETSGLVPPGDEQGSIYGNEVIKASKRRKKTSRDSVCSPSRLKGYMSAKRQPGSLREAGSKVATVQVIQESTSSPPDLMGGGSKIEWAPSLEPTNTNVPSREDLVANRKPRDDVKEPLAQSLQPSDDVRESVAQSLQQFEAKVKTRAGHGHSRGRPKKVSVWRSSRKEIQTSKQEKPKVTKTHQEDKNVKKILSWAEDVEDNEGKRCHVQSTHAQVLAPPTIWWSNSMEAVEVLIDADDESIASASDSVTSNATMGSEYTESSVAKVEFSCSGLKEVTGALVEEVGYVGRDVFRDLARDIVREGPTIMKEWFVGSKKKKKRKW